MNRYASHRYTSSVWTVLLGLLFLLSRLTLSQAQVPVPVITNITPTTSADLDLGTHVNTVETITQITGGTRPNNGTDPGTNLFHSFDFFTLGTGDIAHFLNDMQLPTDNIFGRVIGGEASKSVIDGTLRTNNPLDPTDPMNFGAANLWLVNPSGLLLGPNARVEVGGSVSMSTANYLRFEGTSALFDMLSSPASLGPLSVAPVVAFGFLGLEPPAPITVQGSMLQVPEGHALSLVGGDITVRAETFEDGTIQAASLRAPGGQINLAAVASPGEILIPSFQVGPNINGASFTTMGMVTLKEGAILDVSGQLDEFGTPIGNGKGGTVFVRGGRLELDGSSILAKTLGDVDGDNPGVDLNVTGDAVITNGSVITSGTSGDGRAGDITVNVGTLSLTAGGQINSQNDASFGLGGGGDVQISATDSIMISGQDSVGNSSGILAETQISGDGGSISLTTQTSLTMDQGGTIIARTFGGGSGGEINIAVDTMSLGNGGRITSHTGGFAPGGHVNVTATDSIFLLSGVDSNGNPSGILTSSFFDGQTGNITVDTSKLTLTGGSVIQSGSIFDPQGGNISVNASNSVDISNGSSISSQAFILNVGDISISTPILTIDNGSIQSTTLDFGDAGNIVVNVETLSLSGGARIDSGTSGSGDGGTVTVQGFGGPDTRADAVKISGTDSAGNLSGLFTNAGSVGGFSNPSAAGAGGDIRVFAKGLILESGGTISAVSSSASTLAQGGTITVDANQVRLSTGSTITSASTEAGGEAPGGNVEISTQALTLESGASVSASTAGGGNAGEVIVTTPALNLNDATITTSTSSTGNAGGITAIVGTLSLTGGAQITSASTDTSSGSAGSVTIQGFASSADAVTLTNSSLRTSADSTGRGGSITVDATNVTLNGATISASVKDVNAADVTDGPTSGLGNIALSSSTMNITGGTVTAETSGTRNAGGITITTTGNTLSLANGSRISSASTGETITNLDGTTKVPGTAGTITITDSGSFTSDASSIATSAEANHGGDISITAQNVQLSNGTKIDASSNAPLKVTKLVVNPLDPDGPRIEEFVGFGDAGNITINSASNVAMQNSSVTTEASAASGGDIEILAPDAVMIQLVNSRVSTSVGGIAKQSDGGNITIDPQFVVLQNSQVIAQANAGAGGAINIIATSAFIADPLSIVDASSTLGISGTVNILSPLQNVSGRLTPLSQQFSSAAALLAQRCAARVADGKFSTFVVAGREGLPVEPGGFLASPSWTAGLLGSSLSGRDRRTQFPAVTGLFQEYDARPIQLAKLGNACRQ